MILYLLAINNQTFLKNGFDFESNKAEITGDISQAQIFFNLKDVNELIYLYGGQLVTLESVEPAINDTPSYKKGGVTDVYSSKIRY